MPTEDADARLRDDVRKRETTSEMIKAGRLPSVDELLSGHDFARGDLRYDVHLWTSSWVDEPADDRSDILEIVLPPLRRLHDLGVSVARLQKALKAFETVSLQSEAVRCLCYLACMNQPSARQRLTAHIEMYRLSRGSDATHFYMSSVSLGLTLGACDNMDEYQHAGTLRAQNIANSVAQILQIQAEPTSTDLDEDFIQAVLEDRAESYFKRQKPKKNPSLVVVPTLKGGAKDVVKQWFGIDGKKLPLIQRGNLPEQRDRLVSRFPHLSEVVDLLLSDLAVDHRVRFRPTLLVGAPGLGKSSFARGLAEAVGLPVELVALAGLADSSVMGTSAQWASARESIPLQLIRKTKTANPCIVWDEVDKTASSHNGSAVDALLPMLERSTSSKIRDLALETEVDLSWVSHIATANDISQIPGPLKDRMRIVEMPEPGWQHIEGLVKGILDDIADDRGLDRRWLEDLADDEMCVVHETWQSSSLRQLRRIIEILVDGREKLWGRA